MLFLYVVFIGISLAMDAFAASVSCGMTRSDSRSVLALKVSIYFGVSQAIMFAMGWFLGSLSKTVITSIGNWIAFVLLFIIGGRMIYEAASNWNKGVECKPLKERELLLLSIATSIDALVVGLSFGILETALILPLIVVGGVTFMLSFIGVIIGDGLRSHLDRWAEVLAGMVLIGLGIKFLIEELFL
jgi:putative Mn2+ efflux pump MntP